MRKAIRYAKSEGIGRMLIRCFGWIKRKLECFPLKLLEKIFRKKYIRNVSDRIAGKELFVLAYSFDWNTPLFQRPHQLALALSRCENSHVVFVSDRYKFDNFAGVFSVNSHLDVVSFDFVCHNPQMFLGAKRVNLFKSLPLQIELLRIIPYDVLVYDYIDDLSVIPFCTDKMKKAHYEIIAQADLTVCTARTLYNDARKYTERLILSQNACDYEFFHSHRECERNVFLMEKVKKYTCVLGYYGCLATWFDYDLVLKIAKQHLDWCFVLIGKCFDGSDQILREEGLENIILWDAQPYRELPHYIAVFDVQIIPFKVNQITEGTSPVKLFEYMASGKPILTSSLPECHNYKSVKIYDSAEDFIRTVEWFLQLPKSDEYFAVMEQEAQENTWEKRIDEIVGAVRREKEKEK